MSEQSPNDRALDSARSLVAALVTAWDDCDSRQMFGTIALMPVNGWLRVASAVTALRTLLLTSTTSATVNPQPSEREIGYADATADVVAWLILEWNAGSPEQCIRSGQHVGAAERERQHAVRNLSAAPWLKP